MLNVVHYPAMEGGNELLVNDQEYYVGRPAGSDEVLIPRDAWEMCIRDRRRTFGLHPAIDDLRADGILVEVERLSLIHIS